MLYTTRTKVFTHYQYPLTECAIYRLNIQLGPKWELKHAGIKVCCVSINFVENFRFFDIPWGVNY